MSFLDSLSSLLTPVSNIIDELHTSEEETLLIKAEMKKAEVSLLIAKLEMDKQIAQSQASIIQAEAQGQSWLQRNWRPIMMLTFLILIVCDSFGWLSFRLNHEAWQLLQIGLGGYVVGRSAEKIAPMLKKNTDKSA